MPNRVQDGQQPEAPEQEQDAAAKVLQEGIEKSSRGMEEAARKTPRR